MFLIDAITYIMASHYELSFCAVRSLGLAKLGIIFAEMVFRTQILPLFAVRKNLASKTEKPVESSRKHCRCFSDAIMLLSESCFPVELHYIKLRVLTLEGSITDSRIVLDHYQYKMRERPTFRGVSTYKVLKLLNGHVCY